MKIKTTSSILLAILAMAVPAHAENLVKNGDAETGSGEGWSPAPTVSAGAHGGSKSFLIETSAREICSDLIKVEPEGRYALSGYFKSAGKSTLHLGLQPYDAQGRRINSFNINRLPNTETVLVADAKKGDKTIVIANGEAWKADPKWAAVAFNIDDSRNRTDLPNFNLSALGITDVRKAGDDWEVVLLWPLPATYPAGTLVGEHRGSAGNMYVAGSPHTIGGEWVQISGTVKGMATGISNDQFWPGTDSVKVLVMPNVNSVGAGDALFFDDIVFEKVSD